MFNIYPQLTSQIINSENGYQTNKKKIEKEISIITNEKKSFEI